MGQVLSRKRSGSANINSANKHGNSHASTNGDVVKTETNGSTVQTQETATTSQDPKVDSNEPPKKEKKKRRFFFNLKRSRPGSGRKKKSKKNGEVNTSANSGRSTRASLFMDEFQIPEDDGIDSVSLSSNEDKDSKKRKNSNGEGIRRSKRGSKSSKNGKKDKKKKQKTEKKKEEKSKKKKSKDSSKQAETKTGVTLDVNKSVEPLHTSVEAAQENAKIAAERQDSGVKSGSETEDDLMTAVTSVMDSNATEQKPQTDHKGEASPTMESSGPAVAEEEVLKAETQTSSEAAPSSPSAEPEGKVSPDSPLNEDGTPKRVSLGPRLKTAILKKYSGAGDAPPDSQRVTLTKPKVVDIPDLVPPPRKKRSMKALSQAAHSPSASEHNTSVTSNTEEGSQQKEEKVADQSPVEQIAETPAAVIVNNNSSIEEQTEASVATEKVLSQADDSVTEAVEVTEHAQPDKDATDEIKVESMTSAEQITLETSGDKHEEKTREVIEEVIETAAVTVNESVPTVEINTKTEASPVDPVPDEKSWVVEKGESILKQYEIHIEATRTFEQEDNEEKAEPVQGDPVVVIERVHEEPYFGPVERREEGGEKTEENGPGDDASNAENESRTVVKQKYSKETGEICKECLCDENNSEEQSDINSSTSLVVCVEPASEDITVTVTEHVEAAGPVILESASSTVDDTLENDKEDTKVEHDETSQRSSSEDEVIPSPETESNTPKHIESSPDRESPKFEDFDEGSSTNTDSTLVDDEDPEKSVVVNTTLVKEDDQKEETVQKAVEEINDEASTVDEDKDDDTSKDVNQKEETVQKAVEEIKDEASTVDEDKDDDTSKDVNQKEETVQKAVEETKDEASTVDEDKDDDTSKDVNQCKDNDHPDTPDIKSNNSVIEVQDTHTVIVSVNGESQSKNCDLSDNNNSKGTIVVETSTIDEMIQKVTDTPTLVVTDKTDCDTDGRAAVD